MSFAKFVMAWLTGLLVAGSASAVPITYTFTAQVSGSIGATSFTDETLVATLLGDTANITFDPVAGLYLNETGISGGLRIGNVLDDTITEPLYVFLLAPNDIYGFGADFDLLGLIGLTPPLPNLSTPVSNLTGATYYFQDEAFEELSLSSGRLLSIDALVDPVADITLGNVPVPEPGALALVGVGLFGIALARRQRT